MTGIHVNLLVYNMVISLRNSAGDSADSIMMKDYSNV